MKTEQEIAAALHRYAETTTTSPDAWARINERAARKSPGALSRRLRPVVALALAVGVVVAAVALTRTGAPTREDGFAGVPLRGTAYAFGISAGLDDVVRIDIASGHTDRLTARPQNQAGLVVVDGVVYAGGCGGEPFGLLRLDGAVLRRVPGVPVTPVCSIGAGAAGTVLWVETVQAFEGPWIVHEWDPATSADRVVYESRERVSAPAAGPAGQLAFLEGPEWRLSLTVRSADGRVQRHRLRTRLARTSEGTAEPALSWSPRGVVAIASALGRSDDDEPSTVVVDPRTGQVLKKVEGWAGTAWSPDGAALLLSDGKRPSRLAILRGRDLVFERLHQTAGWMVGRPVAWLDEGVGATAPAIVELARGEAGASEWSLATFHENGKGCLQWRSGRGGRTTMCEIPRPQSTPFGSPLALTVSENPPRHLLVSFLAPRADRMTVTFKDGTSAQAEVVPIALGDEHVAVAFLVVDKAVLHVEAVGTALECVGTSDRIPVGAGCVDKPAPLRIP